MISTRVMNEMEYVKKVKLLMMLGQEAANVSLVGLVHSAMKTKTNAKLVLMRLVFKLTLEFFYQQPSCRTSASIGLKTY